MSQPMPIPGQEDVPPIAERRFREMLAKRVEQGKALYGTTLQTHNGRNALQDLTEELVDAWQYLTQAWMEAEENGAWADLGKRVFHMVEGEKLERADYGWFAWRRGTCRWFPAHELALDWLEAERE